MKPTPQRIRLSRKKNFDLQAVSMALNGLPAVNCARPGRYGNPYRIGQGRIEDASDAVECFKAHLQLDPAWKERIKELRGKNLACWCKDSPCHCDVLLRIANDL